MCWPGRRSRRGTLLVCQYPGSKSSYFRSLLVSGMSLGNSLLLSCVNASLLFLALVISSCPQANTSTPSALIVPDTTEAFRLHQSYFTSLLRKALVKGADDRPVPLLLEQPVMDQGRASTELMKKICAQYASPWCVACWVSAVL
jgi:hypothetical protein